MCHESRFALLALVLPAVASAEPRVTVALPAASSLSRSTVSAPVPTAVGPVTNAWGVAYDPVNRRLYASDPAGNRIVSLNATTGAILTTVLAEPGAVIHGLAADPANRRLWFLDSGTDRVRSLNLDTHLPGTAFDLPGTGLKRPNDIAIDLANQELFVADSAQDTVRRFDYAGTLKGTWSGAGTVDAWGVAVDPATGLVYASSYQNGTVYSWNRDTHASELVATGLAGPRGLNFDRHGRLLCLASGSGNVLRLAAGSPPVATPFNSYPNGRSLRCDDTQDEDADLLPDSWETAYGGLETWSAGSDTDKDGSTAFSELAFGGRPDRSDGSFLKPVAASGDVLTAGFPVRIHDGISYRIWISTNLQSWRVPVVTITETSLNADYNQRQVNLSRASNAIAANEPVFLRIETFKAADF